MEPNQENLPKADTNFVVKKVDTPILPAQIRQDLKHVMAPEGYNIDKPGFYRQNRFYIWAICAGISILSVLSYLAFRKTPIQPTVEANVKVEIFAPETAPSGGEAVYQIKVENQDSQKLVAIQMEITYPSGLVYQSSNVKPQNLSGSLFMVPDLISGQNAVIILKTKISGNINETKILSAKISYKYSNFNSEFTKQTQGISRLVASDISLEISGPSNTSNAQIGLYTLKYKNNSDTEIKGARIKLIFPEGFNFASANPSADLGNNIWNVGNLPKGREGTIEFQGNFRDIAPGEGKTFLAEFLTLGKNGDYFTQSQANFITSIASLPLLVSQALSSDQAKTVVNPGDFLNYEIKYQNNGSVAASGVNIVLTLDSKVLDFASLQAEGGQISGSTITWNAAGNKQLENLAPSEGGTLNFSVEIKNPATKDSGKNLTVVSNVKIKANEYETYFPGNSLNLKVSSPASLAKVLRFVSGTLPPQVGKSSLYKASISILNSSNQFSEAILTAFVATGQSGFVAGSVNSSEASKVDYDPTTGKITWKVGIVPAHAGKFSPAKILDFGVNILPSASQAGQAPVLVKDISFIAKDSFTEQDIILNMDNIQTDDLAGEDRFQNGRVVQ